MKFERGNDYGSLRRGKHNRVTTAMREMVEVALGELGGVAYLVQQGRQNPQAFLALLGKLIPRDLNVTPTGHSYVVTPEQAKDMQTWADSVGDDEDDSALN